jgi:hypothetical protein
LFIDVTVFFTRIEFGVGRFSRHFWFPVDHRPAFVSIKEFRRLRKFLTLETLPRFARRYRRKKTKGSNRAIYCYKRVKS